MTVAKGVGAWGWFTAAVYTSLAVVRKARIVAAPVEGGVSSGATMNSTSAAIAPTALGMPTSSSSNKPTRVSIVGIDEWAVGQGMLVNDLK